MTGGATESELVDERNAELHAVVNQSAKESDRGLVLIIAAHLDQCLQRLIAAFLVESKLVQRMFEGPYAPFGSLSGKTQAAFLLGLISREELDRIEAVRKVRNIFAHEVHATFEHTKVAKLCSKPPIHDGRLNDRDAFLHMAQNTVFPILYRDIGPGGVERRQELVATGKRLKVEDL